MASYTHYLRHLSSVLGYSILPVAARFIPITSNTSRPVLAPVAPESSTRHAILMELELSTPTITLPSSPSSSLGAVSSSTALSQSPSLQISPSTSIPFTSSVALSATQSSSELSTLTAEYLTRCSSLRAATTLASSYELSTAALQYNGLQNLDSNPNSTTAVTPLSSSQLSPYITQSSISVPFPPPAPTSFQSPTPKHLPLFSGTRRWLIVGFSVFSFAILAGLLITCVIKRSVSRRHQKERYPPTPFATTHDKLQSSIGQAEIGAGRDPIASLEPGCSRNLEFGNIQVREVRHRMKCPQLEAWKKGIVPGVDPQAGDAKGKGVKTDEAKSAIGRAV